MHHRSSGHRLLRRFAALLSVMLMLPAPLSAEDVREMEILGWVENIWLRGPDMRLKAKLDSGAETSSLHAIIIKRFREDGKRWVRFQVQDPRSGKVITVVRERQRTIGIVRHAGENQVRPTVLMKYCISGKEHEAEFSLVDRNQFNYPVLLGRDALEQYALIDAGSTFLAERGCAKKKKKAPVLEPEAAEDETAEPKADVEEEPAKPESKPKERTESEAEEKTETEA